ncbi:MAG: hypothetical protein CVT96_00360 [Bacteroidetes bacterium HGW-Bacteroidetes-13]|jgi:hypothetical protein|nr:MAG: hypothetical protein CVT96_00360 [Bacteroidetes bacterium HGW-Bacteroidetes-13]
MELSEIAEVRNWILAGFAIVGAFITIRTYRSNNQQRKLDNTFKTLDYLRMHIGKETIDRFIELFQANNPITSKENEFKLSDGQIQNVKDMFTDGGCGNGEIYNMIQVFDMISKSLTRNLLITELIWYEYGQMISKCYEWTRQIEEDEKKQFKDLSPTDQKFMIKHKSFYYHLNKFMKNNNHLMIELPTKMYTDIE